MKNEKERTSDLRCFTLNVRASALGVATKLNSERQNAISSIKTNRMHIFYTIEKEQYK